ncbi:MAG: hypothetical protein ACI4C3_01150 [Bacteroides sp.]
MEACKFINVGSSTAECKENFSGVANTLFLFLIEDLESAPVYDETKNEFTGASFKFKDGKYPVTIQMKPKSGKVTSSNNAGAGGFSVVYTGVVNKDMDKMAYLNRVANNAQNFGGLVSDGTGKYYALYTPYGIEFGVEFDSGDTPDSDHGHTITITASPMLYGPTKWEGTITIEPETPASEDAGVGA